MIEALSFGAARRGPKMSGAPVQPLGKCGLTCVRNCRATASARRSTSPPGLTRLSCCVAGVARSLSILLGPEEPLLPLPRFGIRLCLDLGIALGLHSGFGGDGGLPDLFTLRFRGLLFRASGGFPGALGCGSLLSLRLLAGDTAGGPFGYHRFVGQRPGLVFRERGAPGAGRRLLSLLKSWILKCRHASFILLI